MGKLQLMARCCPRGCATSRQGPDPRKPTRRCQPRAGAAEHAPRGARVFLARQPSPQGGFRGALSVFQGGNGPSRAALAPALDPASRDPRRPSVRLVVGRASTNSSWRRGGGAWGTGPPCLAALVGPGGARRPLLIRPQLLALLVQGGHPLAHGESGRAWRQVVGEFRSKVQIPA